MALSTHGEVCCFLERSFCTTEDTTIMNSDHGYSIRIVFLLLLGAFCLRNAFTTDEPPARGVTASAAQEVRRAMLGATERSEPIIFVAEWCSFCKALEQELQAMGIPYIRADIDNDPRAQKAYQMLTQHTGGGIPQTLVGDSVISGYNPNAIKKIYGAKTLNAPSTVAGARAT